MGKEINVKRTWKKTLRENRGENGGGGACGACKHFFTDPPPPTFGTSGLIGFLMSKFPTVNWLDLLSDF